MTKINYPKVKIDKRIKIDKKTKKKLKILYKKGWTIKKLTERFKLSVTGIKRIVVKGYAEKDYKSSRKWVLNNREKVRKYANNYMKTYMVKRYRNDPDFRKFVMCCIKRYKKKNPKKVERWNKTCYQNRQKKELKS